MKQKKQGVWRAFWELTKRAMTWRIGLGLLVAFGVAMVGRKISLLKPNYFSQIFALSNPDAQVDLMSLAKILLLLILGGIVVDALQTFLTNTVMGMMDRRLQRQMWHKMSRSPMQLLDEIGASELISRTANDTMKISSAIVYVLIGLVPAVTAFWQLMSEIRKINTTLFKVQLIFMPIFAVMMFLYGRFSYSTTERLQGRLSRVTSHLSELLHSVPFIKAKHTEALEKERGGEKIRELYRADVRMGWLEWLRMPLESVLEILQMLLTMGLGILYLSRGDMTLEQWVEYMMYAQIAVTLLFDFGNFYYLIKSAQGASARISEMLQMPQEDLAAGQRTPEAVESLAFRNVSFAYGNGKQVLNNVSFEIRQGERLVIVGKSGSGKTTLLNLLMRLYTPQSGEILINGMPTDNFSLQSYRERFSVVLQDAPLLSNTVRENVVYGVDGSPTDEEVLLALRLAAADDLVTELEDGLDHEVGIDGQRLSGGQRQRLALARAFLKQAPIAVFDEPTASLDKLSEQQVELSIDAFSKDRLTFLVSHDLTTCLKADKILFLEPGAAHYGTFDDLLELPEFQKILTLAQGGKELCHES